MTGDFQERARRLRNAVEPVAAGVYFAPEAHAAYATLGFAGSPAAQGGVARPELKSYFTSRGACMGPVPGEVPAGATCVPMAAGRSIEEARHVRAATRIGC